MDLFREILLTLRSSWPPFTTAAVKDVNRAVLQVDTNKVEQSGKKYLFYSGTAQKLVYIMSCKDNSRCAYVIT